MLKKKKKKKITVKENHQKVNGSKFEQVISIREAPRKLQTYEN